MQIESKKVLLVEGLDEVGFFEVLCKKINIQDIQIIGTGGKDKFKQEFPIILNARGFEGVTSIVIIRDADESVGSAINSVKYQLKKYNFPIPSGHAEFSTNSKITTGFFIMPGNRDTGMLENLVLDTVKEHPVKLCSDDYINKLKNKLAEPNSSFKFPRNEHKARLFAYLAGMEKFIPSLGMAAKKGYFNLESNALDDIKSFLKKI
ncbi:MAG: DUF3226 domain-containing protein [Mariprofundales bacterium]